MNIEIRALERKDYSKVIDYAIKGMHFERYMDSKLALRLYGRYFLYLELERATQVLAAYMGEQLVGVLMADMSGERKQPSSLWRRFYLRTFRVLMRLVAGGGSSSYDETNKQMLARYLQRETPDGEICFLAADPNIKGKGIGSLLLEELARREPGKLIYLYTDDNCSYQFYERRDFERAEEERITMQLGGKNVPLICLLYSKRL